MSIAGRKRFKYKVQCYNKCLEKNSEINRKAEAIALRDTRVFKSSLCLIKLPVKTKTAYQGKILYQEQVPNLPAIHSAGH